MTPDELLELANACAAKIDLPRQPRVPSLEEVEDQCEEEYEELLRALNEDEVFAVDPDEQQRLSDAIEESLAPDRQQLVAALADLQMRSAWLQQEAAYYVGLAVGIRISAKLPRGTAQ